MVEGNTLPIALSSTALLSVMVYWGDHPGFHCLRIVRPSAIMSSFSNCGIIVPMEVLRVKKIHGNPYLVVRYIPSIRVMLLPYVFVSSF